ncbi:MAG TPA: dCTP deaminase [Xanthobacteraceae bacterium]|nr:dCTP deaminase [Xanthobacteraceae bacterium]
MILSQQDIRRLVKSKKIAFDPVLEETQWGEASVDLRLGRQFTWYRKGITGVTLSVAQGLGTIGSLNLFETEERELYKLDPGELVLALTHESVTVPKNLIARVEGRSTYARVGLSMHHTAPWIQPGWEGQIVLEISNHGSIPIELTALKDRPCQLSFFELKSAVPATIAYGSRATDRYQRQKHPLKHKA